MPNALDAKRDMQQKMTSYAIAVVTNSLSRTSLKLESKSALKFDVLDSLATRST